MEKAKNDNEVLIYQDENDVTRVSVRFSDEDLWVTQPMIAELYDTTQHNISQHIDNIYNDGELAREATNKKFLLVRTEGKRQVKRNIDHYNLDMIIALGYRVQSQVATRFRRWATERLHEYIQIIANRRKLLEGKGCISHKQAIEKAEKEFAQNVDYFLDFLQKNIRPETKILYFCRNFRVWTKDWNESDPIIFGTGSLSQRAFLGPTTQTALQNTSAAMW